MGKSIAEKADAYQKSTTFANLQELLADPDYVILLPDGKTVSGEDFQKIDRENLPDVLQEQYLRKPGVSENRLIVADKKNPKAAPQIIPFSANGIDPDGIRSVEDGDVPMSSPMPAGMKVPGFGAKLKEFFSFITGGSKTVREYNKYLEEQRKYQSRWYDFVTAAGRNVPKPKGYAASQETPETGKISELEVYNMKRRGERQNARREREQTLLQRTEALPEQTALSEAVRENVNGLGDHALGMLAALSDDEFKALGDSFRANGVDKNHVPFVLAAIEKKAEEAARGAEPSKEQTLNVLQEKLGNYQKDKESYQKDYADQLRNRKNRRGRLLGKLAAKLQDKELSGSKLQKALSPLAEARDPGNRLENAALELLVTAEDGKLAQMAAAFEQSGTKPEEIVGLLNKGADPKNRDTKNIVAQVFERTGAEYQPKSPEAGGHGKDI